MFRGILGLIVSVVIIFLSAGALAAARISLCKTKEEKAVFCRGRKFFFLIGGAWLLLAALLSVFGVIGFFIGTKGAEMIYLISLPLFAWGGFEIYPVFNRAFFRDKAEIRSVFCKKTYRYEELSALKIWRGVTRASLSVRYASNLEKIKIYDKGGKVVFKANEDYFGYEEMKAFLRKKGIAIDDKEQKKTEKRNKKKKKKRLENARAEWLEKHPAGNGTEWSDKNRKK